MGSGSSKSLHHQDKQDSDDDNPLSEAALAKRAEDIRRHRFPIELPVDEAIPFEFTAFISPGAFPTPPTNKNACN